VEYTITCKGQPDRVYKGFVPYESATDEQRQTKIMVIVMFDSQPEFYLVDSNEGLSELHRYYSDDWSGTGRTMPVHTYAPALSTNWSV